MFFKILGEASYSFCNSPRVGSEDLKNACSSKIEGPLRVNFHKEHISLPLFRITERGFLANAKSIDGGYAPAASKRRSERIEGLEFPSKQVQPRVVLRS
jgi:hypothetical protein